LSVPVSISSRFAAFFLPLVFFAMSPQANAMHPSAAAAYPLLSDSVMVRGDN
jgi:hypothetical protein